MITILKNQFRFIISLAVLSSAFISCRKNTNEDKFPPPDAEEYLNYTIGTTNYSYTSPNDNISIPNPDSLENQTFGHRLSIRSTGQQDGNLSVLSFNSDNIALNSNQLLHIFGTTNIFGATNPLLAYQNPIYVHITEYGQVGEFIAGNFQGILFEAMHQSQTHNISGSFRVKRIY